MTAKPGSTAQPPASHSAAAPSAAAPRIPRAVRALAAVSLLNDLASEMVYPLLPALVTTRLGGGALALGALDGAAELASSVLKWISGRLADRPGWRGRLVLAGYGIAVAARPLIALATAAWQVVGLRVVDRAGKGLRTPARDALIADAAAPEARGRAFGFHRAADHLGAVLGSLAAWALLAAGMSVSGVIGASVVPGVAVLAMAALAVRWARRARPADHTAGASHARETAGDTLAGPERAARPPAGAGDEQVLTREARTHDEARGHDESPTHDEARTHVEAQSYGEARPPGEPRPPGEVRTPGEAGTHGEARTHGETRTRGETAVLVTLAALTLTRLPETLLLLRLQRSGVAVVTIPLVWAGLSVVRSAGSYPGGAIADRIGPRVTVALGAAVSAGVAALLALPLAAGAAVAVFLGFGLVAGLTEAAERSAVARLAGARLGRGFGAYHALTGAAALPAGLLFGGVYQTAGGPAALLLSAGLTVVAAAAWLAAAGTLTPRRSG